MLSGLASLGSGKNPNIADHWPTFAVGRRLHQIAIASLAVWCLSAGPRAGAVVVTDNFSDGNDTANPTWHHLDGAVGSTGQSWTVTNGQYRLIDPTTTTVGSTFPGLESYGFVGSYVEPQFTDVRVSADFVDFIPPGDAADFFGVAARLNGNNDPPMDPGGIQLHGYTYHYEGTAANGTGEMVLGILHGSGLKDIGSQQVTLDNSKDYRFVLEVVGNVLHGQVFELDGSGNEVAMVAEKMRDIDAQPPGMDDYNFDGVDEDFVPYTSGFSGVFGVGSFLAADADFTIDNFRTETVAGLAGDFDKSGVVDSVDLAQWKGDYGANADSDTNGDGVTDGADFLIWQRNLGATSVSAAAAGVPEPASLVVACVAACGIFSARRRLGG